MAGSPILAFVIIAFMILWIWSKKTGKTISQLVKELLANFQGEDDGN